MLKWRLVLLQNQRLYNVHVCINLRAILIATFLFVLLVKLVLAGGFVTGVGRTQNNTDIINMQGQ